MVPRRLLLGLLLIALAVVAVFWPAGGARVLLATLGLCAVGRGVLLLRADDTETTEASRPVGAAAVVAGLAAVGVAALSAAVTGWVVLVGVPFLILAAALALVGRGGVARRGGLALLVWTGLVTVLLVASGVAQGLDRAAGIATVIGALGVAVLGVPVLISAANATRPVPPAPAGCAGCACGGGGCSLAG